MKYQKGVLRNLSSSPYLVFQVEHQKQIKNAQLVAHQSERIKFLEERVRKMQAMLDAKETSDATDNTHALDVLAAPPGSQTCQEADPKYTLHDLLREWISKEVKLPMELKTEEQSIALKNLETKLLTEVNMMSEGFLTTFQVCNPDILYLTGRRWRTSKTRFLNSRSNKFRKIKHNSCKEPKRRC